MSKYKRLGKNTLLIFIGSAGGKFIGLLMLPLYTSWLSIEEYGATDIINVYVSFFLGIITFSIAESIFIFPKGESKDQQTSYFSTGLVFSFSCLLLSGVFFIIIAYLFNKWKIENSFTNYYFLIYFMICATFLQHYMQQFTRSIDKIMVYSITGIVLTVCTALFSFLLIPNHGVKGYVLSIILSHCIAALYAFIFSKAYTYFSVYSINISDCRKMLNYSIPLIPNSIMWWLVGALNRPIMENYIGMHAIGIYAVANKFPTILSTVYNMFSTSFVISVIEEFNKSDYQGFFNNIFRIVLFFLVIGTCFMTFFSKFFIGIFASNEFYEAWKYLPLLTYGIVFSSISNIVGANFSASKKSKYFFYSSLWGALTSIAFNFLLIPFYGIWGAAMAVVISFIVMALSRIIYSWKYVHIQNIPIIIATLIVGALFIVIEISNINSEYKIIFYIANIALLLFFNRDLLFQFNKLFKKKN